MPFFTNDILLDNISNIDDKHVQNIEINDIIIIPHNVIQDKYIENNDSNIAYKSSLFTYLYKNEECKKYIIHLEQNNEYKIFCKSF